MSVPLIVLCEKEDCLAECKDPDWLCSCGMKAVPLVEDAIQMLIGEMSEEIRTNLLLHAQQGIPKMTQQRIKTGEPSTYSTEEVIELFAYFITGDPGLRVVDTEGKIVGDDSGPKLEIATSMPSLPPQIQK